MNKTLALLVTLGLAVVPLTGCLGGGDAAPPAAKEDLQGTSGSDAPTAPAAEGATTPADAAAADAAAAAAAAAPPAPLFVFESFDVTPDAAGPGEPFTITATVVNAGTAGGLVFVTPLWDDEPAGEPQGGEIPPAGKKEFTFEVPAAGTGTHNVALRIDGGETRWANVRILEPDLAVTDWTAENPTCGDRLALTLDVTNLGGLAAEGYALDVYSTNKDGRAMGHASFALDAVAAQETKQLTGTVFAPGMCEENATYTLTFIVTKDGATTYYEKTEPFRAVDAS